MSLSTNVRSFACPMLSTGRGGKSDRCPPALYSGFVYICLSACSTMFRRAGNGISGEKGRDNSSLGLYKTVLRISSRRSTKKTHCGSVFCFLRPASLYRSSWHITICEISAESEASVSKRSCSRMKLPPFVPLSRGRSKCAARVRSKPLLDRDLFIRSKRRYISF